PWSPEPSPRPTASFFKADEASAYNVFPTSRQETSSRYRQNVFIKYSIVHPMMAPMYSAPPMSTQAYILRRIARPHIEATGMLFKKLLKASLSSRSIRNWPENWSAETTAPQPYKYKILCL